MKHQPKRPLEFCILALTALLAGCSQQTLDSARQDTQRNITAAKPQLAKLNLGSRVTTALVAADIHGVRVDADTSGVSLHGTVATTDEKARAGRIARETLGKGKTVSNQIKVNGN